MNNKGGLVLRLVDCKGQRPLQPLVLATELSRQKKSEVAVRLFKQSG